MTDREAHNRYMRYWRKRHPEKIREYNKRYWRKKAEQTDAEKVKSPSDPENT